MSWAGGVAGKNKTCLMSYPGMDKNEVCVACGMCALQITHEKVNLSYSQIDDALWLLCEEEGLPKTEVSVFVSAAVNEAEHGFMWHQHNSCEPANLAHYTVVLYKAAHPDQFRPPSPNVWEGPE